MGWTGLPATLWRHIGARFALAGAREASARRLAAGPVRRLLVVCHGNIYRSPFVYQVLRARLAQVEIRSAGFHPVSGRASPEKHVTQSREFGVNLDAHRSAVVTRADLEWADTIVLMDRRNWRSLVALGAARERFVWLGTLDEGPDEIADPYGLDSQATARILARLAGSAQKLADRIDSQEVA